MFANYPLKGIEVLEFSERLSVSACGFLLAQLGAQVTVINDPNANISSSQIENRLKYQDRISMDLPITDHHLFFKKFRVIIISLGDSNDDKNKLIHNYLLNQDEHQVICSITDQGLGIENFSSTSNELFIQALSGLMAVSGLPNGKPEFAKIPISEMCAAVISCLSILASIYSPSKQLIDLSQLEIMADQLRTHVSLLTDNQNGSFRLGCGHPLCSPWDAYQASDGWVIICASSDAHWHSLLKLMNLEHLLTDIRFTNVTLRRQHKKEVDEIVTSWTSQYEVNKITLLLREIGLPSGPAANPREVPFDVDLLEAGTVQHEDQFSFARMPIQISSIGPSSPHPSISSIDAAVLPLEGVKVVEFTAYAAGPMAGYLLASLGAEVIKIEAPQGEEGRKFKPQFGGVSGYFINYNAGKKSIAIDLQSIENKKKLYDLIKTADIVLHNMRPGAMEKLGFGVDELLKINPHLIYCSISGYGLSGPKLGALDTVIQGHLGLTGLFGDSNRPIRVGYSIADQLSGHLAAAGMIAALIQRSQINNGQIVDIAMSDSIAWLTQLMWNDSSMAISGFQIQATDGWIICTSSAQDYPKNLNCKELIEHFKKQDIQAVQILEVDDVINQESLVRRGFMYKIKTQNNEMADLISPPLGIPVYEPRILHPLGTHNYLLNTQK